MKKNTGETLEAVEKLKQFIKPGDTVYTILRNVSRSGMSRRLTCHAKTPDGLMNITYWVAKACGETLKDAELYVTGCGQDMGYAVVHNLGYVMYPDGYKCAGDGCCYNDHSNTPYPKRDGKTQHPKTGYVFRQAWL